MSVVKMLKCGILAILAALVFLSTFKTTIRFVCFLSEQHIITRKQDASSLEIMFTDLALLLLFTIQHSVMASDWWKFAVYELGLSVINRTVYLGCTSSALQLLMVYWRPVLCCGLWWIDTSDSLSLWLFFTLVHVMAWIIIFGATLTMDFAELMGIKQVFYFMLGRDPPLLHKSYASQKLFRHMRHPGTVCFLVILWVHPIMTFSRLLCAVTLTLYLLLGFRVTEKDCSYLQEQMKLKTEEFGSSTTSSDQ